MTFNRGRVTTFKSSSTWLHPLTGEVRGAEILLDFTGEFTITQEVEAYDPQDDSGQIIDHAEIVKSVKIEAKFKGSDDKIRQMFQGQGDQTVKGKTFGITTQLADYPQSDGSTKTGYYTFYKCVISQAGTFALGTSDHGFTLTAYCLPNKTCATYTATLPTGTCFKPTAVSAGIAADEFYYTEDGAIV